MCPHIPLTLRNPAALARHIGVHMLFGDRARIGDNPCGFCFGFDGSCKIWVNFRKGRKGSAFIDMKRSKCPNLCKLSLGESKAKKARCTNKPVYCPICGESEGTFWMYNMEIHLTKVHGLEGAALERHKKLYAISTEEIKYMRKQDVKIRNARMTHSKIQRIVDFRVSEAHQIIPPK
jgi:hypothetical protein